MSAIHVTLIEVKEMKNKKIIITWDVFASNDDACIALAQSIWLAVALVPIQ